MSKQLTFISPAIIERLENGSFVPARRSTPQAKSHDRRNVISPLAVTKRCIRYDPNIFHHRKEHVLRMAHMLNHPDKKILLVGGSQGSGKTSLARGLIELMGSSNEQLLWFDVNRHTDFEEIIQFLIQYITYVCTSANTSNPAHAFKLERRADRSRTQAEAPPEEPLKKLETLINRVADMPLLLVLDNVEYIVDAERRFNSYPFKEMLNFLLAFPNIKMILIGERLPLADMSPNQEGIDDIKLSGLGEEETIAFMQSRKRDHEGIDPALLEQAAAPEAETAALRQLYFKTQGFPWLLKVIFYLNHHASLDFYTLNRLLESRQDERAKSHQPSVGPLIKLIYDRMPDQQRRIFQVLCFLRHPVNAKTLLAMVAVCFPVLGPSRLDADTLEDLLEHSLIRPMLKISYPPQEVLNHIQHRQKEDLQEERNKKYKPWYELYHVVKRLLHHSLPLEERERIHAALQDFYMHDKGQDPAHRIMRIKNRALLAEAKFHGSAARNRKSGHTEVGRGGHDDGEERLDSKAYLYQHVKPLSNKQHLTLDDYRNIRIPDTPLGDAAELSLDGPTFLEIEAQRNSTAGKAESFSEYLAGIELSDEEKNLLYDKDPATARPDTTVQDTVPDTLPTAAPEPLPAPPESKRKPKEKPSAKPQPSPNETSTAASNPQELHHLTESLLNETHGDPQERAIQKRLAAAVTSKDKPAMMRELVELARYRLGHGRYESAGQCLEKALSLKVDAGKETLAEVYRLSGSVHKETYHHNAAMAALSKAAVVIKRLMYEDDTVSPVWMDRLGEVYQNLGEIQSYRKQFSEAVESFRQAMRWYHSADDVLHEAEVMFQLGNTYYDLRDTENAMLWYAKALALDEQGGNKLSAASALANIASLHHDAGRLSEALTYAQRSLTYDREVNNTEGQMNTLEFIASLFAEQNNWSQAESVCQQGLTLALQEGSRVWQASFYLKLGEIATGQEQWAQAVKYYELARSSGEADLAAESLRWIDGKIRDAKQNV